MAMDSQYELISMKSIYSVFAQCLTFAKQIKVKSLLSSIPNLTQDDISSISDIVSLLIKYEEDTEKFRQVFGDLNLFPMDLVFTPMHFLLNIFKEMIKVSKEPSILSSSQQKIDNWQNELQSKSFETMLTVDGCLDWIVIVEKSDNEIYQKVDKDLKQVFTILSKRYLNEIAADSIRYLSTIISLATNYVDLLSSIFTKQFKDHFPIYYQQSWIVLDHTKSISKVDMTGKELEELSLIQNREPSGNTVKTDVGSRKRKNESTSGNAIKVVVKQNRSVSPRSSTEDESVEAEEYPHHSARKGNRYQAEIESFQDEIRSEYLNKKRTYEMLWDPDKIPVDELERFTSQFPQDILENVYDVIVKNKYDLSKSYEELMRNPPLNPITLYSPEDEKKLEDNIDNMALVHHYYFPQVNIQNMVDLYYHMDASFKDDICTICSSAGSLIFCSKCPRGFHKSCIKIPNVKEFICPFCLVTKESLSPNEIDRILAKYRMHLAENHGSNTRGSSRK